MWLYYNTIGPCTVKNSLEKCSCASLFLILILPTNQQGALLFRDASDLVRFFGGSTTAAVCVFTTASRVRECDVCGAQGWMDVMEAPWLTATPCWRWRWWSWWWSPVSLWICALLKRRVHPEEVVSLFFDLPLLEFFSLDVTAPDVVTGLTPVPGPWRGRRALTFELNNQISKFHFFPPLC